MKICVLGLHGRRLVKSSPAYIYPVKGNCVFVAPRYQARQEKMLTS